MLKVAVLMSCVILVVESIVELFALKLRFRLGSCNFFSSGQGLRVLF